MKHRIYYPDDPLPPPKRPFAGVDEAGRGPLAGPVVAAAIILNSPIDGLDDSKKLSEKRRETLFQEIVCGAHCYAIVAIEPQEIDQINIFQATLKAMAMALSQLEVVPREVAIDGKFVPTTNFDCYAAIKGDARIAEISAASILAKVHRDRIMAGLHSRYPDYGWDRNKGYPTAQHLAALQRHGASPIHRRSFSPVRKVLNAESQAPG